MLFRAFKKLLPAISKTEKIALQCGTLSLDRPIFENKVSSVLAQYKLRLSEKEKDFLANETERLCKTRSSRRDDSLSEQDMNMIRADFLGLCIPESHEGKGFSSYAHSRIVQKISSACVSTAVTVMVPNSLGPAELLHKYGTEEQKNKYLHRLASGQIIPCFGLTGPHNGSDALGQLDRGKRIDDHTLEWQCNKRWITLAPIADLVGLAIHVEDYGPTVLLLERDEIDWEIGDRHNPMGGKFMNGTIKTRGPVRVSTEKILGGPDKLGKGWEMLMECLSEGRGISLPALSVGVGCALSLQTSYYAKARKQFHLSLSDMQGVQEKLGKIIANTYTTLAMHELFNATLLRGEKSSVLSAILKYRTTELARESVLHAMDIFAGKGISLGPRNPVASVYSQMPIAITVEGSKTWTRSLIVFAQGIQKSHPYVGEMVEALANDDSNAFWRLFPGMVGYVSYHYARLWIPSFTHEQRLHHRNSLFITLSTVMLLKGKRLKKDQRQTGRMADVLSLLYTAYALQWFQQHQGIENALLQHTLYEIDGLCTEICREQGRWASLLFLPWVRTAPISDATWTTLSQAVLEKDSVVDNLFASYVYLDDRDPISQYRNAVRQGIQDTDKLVEEIIQVDAYPTPKGPCCYL